MWRRNTALVLFCLYHAATHSQLLLEKESYSTLLSKSVNSFGDTIVRIEDFNTDGQLDVFIWADCQIPSILLNDGRGNFRTNVTFLWMGSQMGNPFCGILSYNNRKISTFATIFNRQQNAGLKNIMLVGRNVESGTVTRPWIAQGVKQDPWMTQIIDTNLFEPTTLVASVMQLKYLSCWGEAMTNNPSVTLHAGSSYAGNVRWWVRVGSWSPVRKQFCVANVWPQQPKWLIAIGNSIIMAIDQRTVQFLTLRNPAAGMVIDTYPAFISDIFLQFKETSWTIFSVNIHPIVADINGDGMEELIVVRSIDGIITVTAQFGPNAKGSFSRTLGLRTVNNSTGLQNVHLVDIDRDGQLDVVLMFSTHLSWCHMDPEVHSCIDAHIDIMDPNILGCTDIAFGALNNNESASVEVICARQNTTTEWVTRISNINWNGTRLQQSNDNCCSAAPGWVCPHGAREPQLCPVGFYPTVERTSCSLCPQGFFCGVSNQSGPPQPCAPGNWSNEAEVSPQCQGRCQPGYYCPAASSNATAVPCPVGRYGLHEGLPDANCSGVCPRQYYCPTTALVAPLICPKGYICPSLGMTFPEICDIGMLCAVTGMVAPELCPSGFFCGKRGTVIPEQCPRGFICAVGSTEPEACPGGYYCETLGSSSPTAVCISGTFCPRGTIVPITCPEGHYCVTQSSEPMRCPPTTVCSNRSSTPQSCLSGFYCPDGVQMLPCPPKTTCLGSMAQPVPCENGTLCNAPSQPPVQCPSGSWCVNGVAHICSPGNVCPSGSSAPTVCGAGYYCATSALWAPTAACDGGTYCPRGSKEPMTCPIGFFCIAQAAAPIPCLPSTFCPEGSSTPLSCLSGFVCPDGASLKQCDLGTFCPPSSITPIPCGNGTFCATPATPPVPCLSGYFCRERTAVQEPCPPGFYCPSGSVKPFLCPRGNLCPALSSTPSLCPAGNYCPEGLPLAQPCPKGTQCPTGASEPLACPKGSYCPSSALPPLPCVLGTFCGEGAFEQTLCAPGYVCASPSEERECPEGHYCPAGSTAPQPCQRGSFCPVKSPASLPCPAGKLCGPAQGHPAACPRGNWCPAAINASLACVQGSLCLENSTREEDCPRGFVCGTPESLVACVSGFLCPPRSSTPQKCATGLYCPDPKAENGTECPAGFYCPPASSVPSPCAPRGKQCTGGAGMEAECPSGFCCSNSSEMATGCEAGTFCPEGSAEPLPCPSNTFCTERASSPEPCPRLWIGKHAAAGTMRARSECDQVCYCVGQTSIIAFWTLFSVFSAVSIGGFAWMGAIGTAMFVNVVLSLLDFATDMAYLGLVTFSAPWLQLGVTLALLAPLLPFAIHELFIIPPRVLWKRGLRYFPQVNTLEKALANVVIAAVTLSLNAIWLLFWGFVGVGLCVTKASVATRIRNPWLVLWHGSVPPSQRSDATFAPKQYNMILLCELLLKTVPQMVFQGINNSATGSWGPLEVVSASMSAIMAASSLWRFGYYMCVEGKRLREVPTGRGVNVKAAVTASILLAKRIRRQKQIKYLGTTAPNSSNNKERAKKRTRVSFWSIVKREWEEFWEATKPVLPQQQRFPFPPPPPPPPPPSPQEEGKVHTPEYKINDTGLQWSTNPIFVATAKGEKRRSVSSSSVPLDAVAGSSCIGDARSTSCAPLVAASTPPIHVSVVVKVDSS